MYLAQSVKMRQVVCRCGVLASVLSAQRPTTHKHTKAAFTKWTRSCTTKVKKELLGPQSVEYELANLSAEENERLKSIQYEYEWLQATEETRLPDTVEDKHWLEMVKHIPPTPSARRSYYNYLFKTEKKKEGDVRKRALGQEKHEQRKESFQRWLAEGNVYANHLLLPIRKQAINNAHLNNLVHAWRFGQRVVVDCSYEEEMSRHNVQKLMNQIQDCHAANKVHKRPVHLHFCSVQTGSFTEERLYKTLANLESIPYEVNEDSYLEHYEKDKLVYLTPDSPHDLQKFGDNDDVYIIGALVDKTNRRPVTYAKATRQGIRSARLPLHLINYAAGDSRSLPLNICLQMLLDFRLTHNWEQTILSNAQPRMLHPDKGKKIKKTLDSIQIKRGIIEHE